MSGYVSIDIETTGLNPRKHNILEVGAVLDDLWIQAPLAALPRFHAYILPPRDQDPDSVLTGRHEAGDDYVGEPYALQMNQRILERIAKREPGYNYYSPAQATQEFEKWALDLGLWKEVPVGRARESGAPSGYTSQQVQFVGAGKNFAGFDRPFLDTWLGFKQFRVHHRVMDPAMLYFDPAVDTVPPDLKKCLERAGLESEVTHEAIDDAMLVVKLLRAAFPLVDGVPTRKAFP